MARTLLPTLDELILLDLAALKQTWTLIFAGPPPARMPRDFLMKLLAQGLQELAIGGLPKALERALAAGDGKESEPPGRDDPSETLTLGTRLVRSWGNTNHEVTVIEHGFAYRGKSYRSLSEVARTITGARWSGPRFFGLKQRERTTRTMESQA